MKRFILMMVAAAAVLVSCEKKVEEISIPDEQPVPAEEVTPAAEAVVSEPRTITVLTQETKTAITPKPEGGYSMSWEAGDAIRLFEIVYENYGSSESNAKAIDWFSSEGLDADKQIASFTVNLNSQLSASAGAKYRYIGTYPTSDNCSFYYYWTDDQTTDNDYDTVWAGSECTINHPVLYVNFPTRQSPSATSFDPDADLMVSSQKVLDERAKSEDALTLNFARIGAIVKVTLSGLVPNEIVRTGYIQFGDSYKVAGSVEYDPELGEERIVPMNENWLYSDSYYGDNGYLWELNSTSAISFFPQGLTVDSEGKADIWLRLPEGVVTDSFFIRVWTRAEDSEYGYGDWHSFGKSVDLKTSGKSLTFSNGKLTAFSVAAGEMEDPSLKLSCTYTDHYGLEQTVDSDYYCEISDLSPDDGTLEIDVTYNMDLSDIVVDSSTCDWMDASFDPVTSKITLNYDANPEYVDYSVNYPILTRSDYITVNAGSISKYINLSQYKRDFRNLGQTLTGYMFWKGGEDTTDLICNFTPEVVCDDPTLSWTVTPYQKSGLCHIIFVVNANPLQVTDTQVSSDLVIRDPLDHSKQVTIRIVRFKKLAPGEYWVVSKGGDSWRSFNIERTFENEEIIVSKTFSLGTSELPEAQVMVTPDSEGLIATPMIFEPIEGSDKYFIYVNLGKDEHGDDIIRYLRKSGQMSHINQFFDSHNHYALVPISGRDSWCEWYVNYVEDVVHVYCDADSGGDQDKVGLLCMGSVTVSENNVTKYRIGCYGASLLNYKGSFDYYGITRHDGMPLYDITLIPYEDTEPLPVAVTAVSVEPSAVALDPGETTSLTATVTPAGAADKSVSWSSGNEAVATVDASGVVTAIKPGEAVITATTTDGSFTSSCTVTVNAIPVTGVTLDKTEVELKVGNTLFLTATVTPSTATNADVTFTIASGSDVIEMVEGSGTATSQAFTALKTGQAYITVTTQDGGYQANCHVTVYDDVKVSSIILSPDNVTLDPGESVVYYESGLSYPNTYSVLPGNAANRVPAVSSSDQSVVTAFGDYSFLKGYFYTISAVAPGQTTVTFQAQDGSGVSATLTVTVNEIKNVESISLSMTEVSLYEGEEVVLTPQFTPSDATNQQVSWSSSDNNVATVSGGQVTAVSSGTATITSTSADGGHTATCTVTVKEVVLETSGAVDMGLTSGLLWAPTNYGADTPDEYGTFFSWAGISLSGGWQTPTKEQYEELIAGCQIHSVRYSSVPGLLFVSNTNQKCLFFPKAGFTYNGTSQGSGYYIVLWTATEISDTMVYQFVYDGQTAQLRSGEKALFTAPVRCVKYL